MQILSEAEARSAEHAAGDPGPAPDLEHIARLVEAVQCPRLAAAWRAWWAFKHPSTEQGIPGASLDMPITLRDPFDVDMT